MKFGNKVINYAIYGKINNKLKALQDTTDCELPSIEYATDTVKGAGIMGEIDWPTVASPGSMTFKPGFRIDGEDAIQLSAPKVQEFEVRWVTDKFDSSNMKSGIDAHKAVIKGFPKKYEAGKLETGNSQDASGEFEVIYYKKLLNGKTVLEIDKLNYKFVVNGTDYAKQIKSAL